MRGSFASVYIRRRLGSIATVAVAAAATEVNMVGSGGGGGGEAVLVAGQTVRAFSLLVLYRYL